ncbi:hypothetical protein VF14_18195 [Nostoc linckia z18]|uniref:Uncharacterized protein n=2 Tax=Nostoc linckia TaxID=92942 RepID=A0A9Q6EI21_NOSLI|nr:hypothetical protein [Nostoc linckia]PHJ81489.1 hypothetical protein VF04_37575 [Nostoc linckia z7]PHJ81994.1 hypothetical protein VF07_29335 [Nostoc linckia z6]PHJ94031.1 hypothetical protein VF08_34445 [Nostoc linckia z8]PHK09338.1 hypothetical protein VF09_16110 [Nostoc linckia z9]PHK33058.1 hypothetical protein VF14_18195 [Nostoc linckia z18]
MAERKSRFAGLRDLQKGQPPVEPEAVVKESLTTETEEGEAPAETPASVEKRTVGRPRGRRSDPNYTQISAYVPLDLVLDVQEALAKDKRRTRRRTAMTASELVENLLRDWLEKQKAGEAE